MMIPEIQVNLDSPASNRWNLSSDQVEQAKELLKTYLTDLGGATPFGGMLTEYAQLFVASDYLDEIKSLAKQTNSSLEEALLVNLYYDAIKVVLGCTAFAIDTPKGPMHARNLDWWTENAILGKYTTITQFNNSTNNRTFKTVGWPGFVGTLSGMAPNRFAISLNAVLSDDPPAFAKPISLFLRTVFETAKTYTEAVDMLMNEDIASDCLLLISGTKSGEMAVIERTPTRSAIRHPENGFVAVANEYVALNTSESKVDGQLQATSIGRFENVSKRLTNKLPKTLDDCLEILCDPAIKMSITVQQMAFCASTGELKVQLPQ